MSALDIKLTQFSHGAGCGCKISPGILEDLLQSDIASYMDPSLIVGNHTNDDAAVYDLHNGSALISTVDFFMPIVDDPYDFGAIASVNALSDIYAMGGKPTMANAILGWPVNKIPPDIAKYVLDGSRKICTKAGIALAGGHSIDSPEPIYGLAVSGIVKIENLKTNNKAKPGSLLYLTKPLGIGIMATALKKGIANPKHLEIAKNIMLLLNDIGYELGNLSYVNGLTDVTGFGLLGHLKEVCDASNLSAWIEFKKVPRLKFIDNYVEKDSIPGGTIRNWESYSSAINPIDEFKKAILADPQTSGGLLISVDENHQDEFEHKIKTMGYPVSPFGRLTERSDHAIIVE